MTREDASDLAHRLGREAEAVCRHYLDAGHRQGNYWQVGDARNTPGRSMFVRLKDTVKGPAGKWTDYVARRIMLRPRVECQCCGGLAALTQHNLSPSGRVA